MSLSRCLAAILVLAPLAVTTTAPATAKRVRTDVTGVFRSNWDEVQLRQRGDVVTGTYVCCGGGTIEGRIVEGRVVRYRWKQPGAEGRGVWTIEDPDRLQGTWGVGHDEVSGGRWDLQRGREIAQ
jgi:hypothetical protein